MLFFYVVIDLLSQQLPTPKGTFGNIILVVKPTRSLELRSIAWCMILVVPAVTTLEQVL